MEKEILFSENQRFKQWWLLLPLVIVNGLFLFSLITDPDSTIKVVIPFAAVFLITVLFFSFRLNTQIKADGIYVQFFPFHLSFKHFKWNQFKTLEVKQYSPLIDYGGWGSRVAVLSDKGKVYSVSGNIGLQIVFVDNEKLMIGTKKGDEMIDVLKKLGKL